MTKLEKLKKILDKNKDINLNKKTDVYGSDNQLVRSLMIKKKDFLTLNRL